MKAEKKKGKKQGRNYLGTGPLESKKTKKMTKREKTENEKKPVDNWCPGGGGGGGLGGKRGKLVEKKTGHEKTRGGGLKSKVSTYWCKEGRKARQTTVVVGRQNAQPWRRAQHRPAEFQKRRK